MVCKGLVMIAPGVIFSPDRALFCRRHGCFRRLRTICRYIQTRNFETRMRALKEALIIYSIVDSDDKF